MRCSSVAFPITRSALLLRPAADPERELDLAVLAPVTWPLIRETAAVWICTGAAMVVGDRRVVAGLDPGRLLLGESVGERERAHSRSMAAASRQVDRF